MFLNDFSVVIPQGSEQNGYVLLPHDTVYTLRIRNRRSVDCDVCVEIDGKGIGTWRLQPGQSIELERPADDTGHLTFYRSGTKNAGDVGEAYIPKDAKGLVKVSFLPNKHRVLHKTLSVDSSHERGNNPQYEGGGTTSAAVQYSAKIPNTQLNERSYDPNPANFTQCSTGTLNSMSPPSGSQAGVTGLTGVSAQQFGTIGPLSDPDYSQMTIIQLRLVEGKDSPRELKPATNSTAYPPPVD